MLKRKDLTRTTAPTTSSDKTPRILLVDIENSPNISYVWGHYEQNVIAHVQENYLLSFAYKWLGDKNVQVKSLPEYKGYKPHAPCDKGLAKDLWELFDEADIIIGHNGDAFDIKKANTRFIYHGFMPPSDYRSVDTLKLARKYFKFNSNKLDDLGNFLGVGRKVKHTGFSLWLGCIGGEKESWDVMCEYNKQDVSLLENVYLKLRTWHTARHPNVSALSGRTGCPGCGSVGAQKRGFSYTNLTKAQRYQCKDCKGYYLGTRTRVNCQ